MADATSRSETSGALTAARVLVTIVGISIATQALTALATPPPGETRNFANLVPAGLACLGTALVWRRRPAGVPAVLTLFAAVGIAAFTMFGDTAFARAMAGILVGVLALVIAWVGLVLPLLVWRRGRWPTEPLEFVPYAPDAPDTEPLRARREALEALGFSPRLVLARSERGASVTIVAFSHATRSTYASLRRIAVGNVAFASTQVFSAPENGVTFAVGDALGPSPFPPGPGMRFLLFRDADAAALLAHFERLRPSPSQSLPLSDQALAATMQQSMAGYERYLVEAGYLATAEENQSRRYTLKGGFSAALRPRWPWYHALQARCERDGRAALRAVSRSAA